MPQMLCEDQPPHWCGVRTLLLVRSKGLRLRRHGAACLLQLAGIGGNGLIDRLYGSVAPARPTSRRSTSDVLPRPQRPVPMRTADGTALDTLSCEVCTV